MSEDLETEDKPVFVELDSNVSGRFVSYTIPHELTVDVKRHTNGGGSYTAKLEKQDDGHHIVKLEKTRG